MTKLELAVRNAQQAYQFEPNSYNYAAWASLQNFLNAVKSAPQVAAEPVDTLDMRPGQVNRAFPSAGKITRRI